MNSDGWGQVGAGDSDMRVAGSDLQHYRQPKTADEAPGPKRIVTQQAGGGGPMKEHMDHDMKHDLHHHLEMEKMRHGHAKEHEMHHLERHHKRPHDSQHGHDHHKHHYDKGM